MKPGDPIRYLEDYNFFRGTFLKENRLSYLILTGLGDRIRIKKEKCAALDEEIVVVAERWKGVNGRGAHRIERTLYPEHRKPARVFPVQLHAEEEEYGKGLRLR